MPVSTPHVKDDNYSGLGLGLEFYSTPIKVYNHITHSGLRLILRLEFRKLGTVRVIVS